jgi:hypothetical protein
MPKKIQNKNIFRGKGAANKIITNIIRQFNLDLEISNMLNNILYYFANTVILN